MSNVLMGLAAALLLAQSSGTQPLPAQEQVPPPGEPESTQPAPAAEAAPSATDQTGTAEAPPPTAAERQQAMEEADRQEARARAERVDQRMQSMDQHLIDLNEQAAAAQQTREEMANIARNDVAIRQAAQQRVVAYGSALTEIAAIDSAMAYTGAPGQVDRLEALRQFLMTIRSNADASDGQPEALLLDRALAHLSDAEAALAGSDYFGARNSLASSTLELHSAVNAAAAANPTP